jgi:LysR family nod box-dependent transcriptional activator
MRFHGLDLNLLVVLDVLLAEQNITRAGVRLHLSQPATSAALSRLRSYFDDELLVQIGRKMVRTPVGETLAQPIRDLLIQMRSTLESRAQFQPELSSRKFTLMASDYVGMVLLPQVSREMSRVAPQCSIEQFSPTDEAALEIERGHVDFLLLPDNHILSGHPSIPLFEDEYVCVMCQENPLSAAPLSFEDYKSMGHVLVRWGSEHRTPTVDEWFLRSFGFERRVEVTTNAFNSVPAFLIGTQRIATMHHRLAERWANYLPLKIQPVPWDAPKLTIAMQWNKYQLHDPGLAWLRNLIVSTATGMA